MKEGRKELKRLLKKNRETFKDIDKIFSSPFLRALETAEILYAKYPSDQFELQSLLETNVRPVDFVNAITMKNDPKVCFVGHEPHLTESVKILLKSPALSIELEKAGAIVLEGESLNNLKLTQILRP